MGNKKEISDLLKSIQNLTKYIKGLPEKTVAESPSKVSSDLENMSQMNQDNWGTDKDPASLEHTRDVYSNAMPNQGTHFLQNNKVNPEHRERPWKAYELGMGQESGKPLNDGMAMSAADLMGHLQSGQMDPHRTVIAPSHGQGDWVQFIQHPTFKDQAKNIIGNLVYSSSREPAAHHESTRQNLAPKSINAMNPKEIQMLRRKK